MSKEQDIIIIAAYLDTEPASKNFDALVRLVKDKKIKSDGMILVKKDQDGKVSVQETGDHAGRKGMGWGGGVGVLVGLFAPAMLGAVVVGAAAGALAGKFVKNKIVNGVEGGLGQNIKPGTAAILAIVGEDDKLAAQQALVDSPAKSVAVMEEGGVKGLKAALAEAAGKFNPDRTVLPIPDKKFGGVAGRTMDTSTVDWSFVAGAKAPDDAPNVLLILIDDAGFGQPDTFGGPIPTPNFSRIGQQGLIYNRFHVVALCSPTRAALLTGRNQHRVGMGSIAEFPGPFPGYTGNVPRTCAPFPKVLKENGYVTGGFGKWHMTPDREQGPAGPFNHWPLAWGFDHF
ncbi:MAG: sulfatase-like hydrolase/transferase, partial [Bacteroidota bacterium]